MASRQKSLQALCTPTRIKCCVRVCVRGLRCWRLVSFGSVLLNLIIRLMLMQQDCVNFQEIRVDSPQRAILVKADCLAVITPVGEAKRSCPLPQFLLLRNWLAGGWSFLGHIRKRLAGSQTRVSKSRLCTVLSESCLCLVSESAIIMI